MSHPRRSLIRSTLTKLRQLWQRREETRRDVRRCLGSTFEMLEPRYALTIGGALPSPTDHIHPILQIYLEGQQVVIPTDVGFNGSTHANPHTHDFTGTIHIGEGGPAGTGSTVRNVTLDDFFDVWSSNTLTIAGPRNANAVFDTNLTDGTNQPRIMDKTVNSSTHVLRMYVKETGDSAPELEYDSSSSSNNLAQPELYVPRDGDQIIISYDKIANVVDAPSFQPIANQTVLVGAPTVLGIDGFDPTGGPLTYSISVANPALLSATLQPTSNRSIVMNVTNYGQMTFQLFDNLTPRAAQHLAQIVNNGEYNNIKFYRIAHLGDGSDFVIQGGRNGVASSLGRFDDEFHTDLQFTAPGLLAMAKSTDDTNDAEIFVTGGTPRFLDMNHSIFGVLTDGDEVREAIQQSRPTGDGAPPSDIIVSSTQVVTDNQNAALMLKAAAGATGSTNVTMTVTDQQGKTFSQTFTVSFANDTANSAPFLNPISPVTGVSGQPITLQLTAQDAEGDPFFFDATKPASETVAYTVTPNNNTGLVTITPPAGFVGTFNVQVGVRGTTQTTTNDQFDTQLVSVTVGAGSPTLDLAAISDSGSSNSDNITNASSLNFDLTGLTSGGTVRILKGTTVIAQGVATSSTMTLTVADPGTALGQGVSELTVTQTVNGTTSPASAPLSVTYDTAVPTFSSTAPTTAQIGFNLNYNAQTNEEGGTNGVLYTLTNAPTGASINGSTGVVTWSPTAGQSPGPNNFSVVATDAAGNVATQALAVAVAAAQVDIKLELRDTNGVLLTSLSPGQDFVLRVLTQDVRSQPRGVFALYTDITYDSTKVSVTGPIAYSNTYASGRSGTTTTAGLIDEVGAFAGTSELGSSLFEVFTIPMRAATGATGTITFLSDPADVTPSHNVLVYGGSGTPGSGSPPVPPAEIHFGNASIEVGATFNAVNDTGANFTVNEDTSNNTINPLANDANIGSNTNTLTISAVGTPSSGGTITRTQNNTRISYTPAANFQGTETFTYTARNQNGEEHIATVTMTVTNVNDPPVAVNDTLSASRNSTATTLNVLGNDTKGNDATDTTESLRVSAVGTGSAGGTITIGPNGANVIYTPANNFSGTETFTYTITDRATGGLTATATATVSVSGLTANNDSGANFTVAEDSQNTTINPLANDALDTQVGGTLTITAVGTTSNGGTVSITENSTRLSYKPAANFQGTETFTYTISDGQGHNATATVSMTVTNVNDPPTAVNDTLTAFRNTTASLDVLANDTSTPDPTENLIIQAIATQPTNGTATITDAGKKISYTPNSGFTGSDSFTYTVRDPSGAESTATANITVQDFAPSNLSGFVYFDVNDNGIKDPGELAMAGVTITLTGTATAGGTTNVNVTAKTGEDGSYKFENIAPGTNFRLTQTQPLFTIDGKDTAGSQGGTVTNNVITIANLAQATTGVNNNFGEMGRQITTISIRDFFSSTSRNYAHAAFDNAGVEVWHSTSGTVWQGATHAFTLQNNQSQIKLDSTNGLLDGQPQVTTRMASTDLPVYLAGTLGTNRLYYIPGGGNGTNGGISNLAPTAVADVFGTPTGTALTVTAANGVLKNDTDPENNTLTASIVTQPTSGTVTLSSNGGFTYTPASGFTGSATFTYRVSDGNSQSAPATVTINVGPGTAPTAADDSFTATEDTPLTVTAANGVLKNDTDVENNTLTAAIVTQPTKGTVTLNNDGSFTYSPTANANGSDTFTYRASDGTNQSQPATVTITINALNDAPSFTIPAAPAAVNEDAAATTVNNFITNILAGGTDESGQTLTFNLTAGATTGGLTFSAAPTISPSGVLTYTPTANTSGTAVFNVTLSDNGSNTSPNSNNSTSQAFTITVNPVNDAPSFTLPSNTTTASEDAGATTVNGFATNISSGPTDETTQSRTFNLTLGTPTGSLAFSTAPAIDPTTGNLTFTPVANTNGSVVVTVTLTDTGSGTAPNVNTSASQTFTINVTAVADPPVGVADSYRVAPGGTLTVNQADGVLKNDTADGTLTVVSVTGLAAGTVGQPVATAHGSVTLSANGSFTYTPTSGFIGTDTFTYTASDGTTQSAATTVTIVVNASPVAQGDTFSTNEGTVLNVTGNGVLQNDTDPNISDTLTATDVTQPANGTVTLNANGSFTYTPNPDFSGTDTFTYRANDGLATSNVATVTVTVNAVNDAPSFTLPATAPAVSEDAGAVEVATFVTAISAGPTNESSQTLTFLVTVTGTTGNLAFTTAPAIDATGKLTYTPAANTNGTATLSVVLVDSGSDTPPNDNTSNTQTFSITVDAVNDAPARTSNAAAAITADEDSAATAVALGLSGLTYDTGGGSDEDTQTLSAKLTAIPSFIEVFHADGTTEVGVNETITIAQLLALTYKTVGNANGTGNLTWNIQDNGGTASSGVDTLADSVAITINAVNDAPSFTVPSNADAVDEDDGDVEVPGFVTNPSVGPADESNQTFTFSVNVTSGASLFATPPAIDSAGQLTYTLADDANGTATITVVMNDSGGGTAPNVNASAPQTVTITVNAINDEPSFTLGDDIEVNEDAGAGVPDFATAISAGPSDESAQTLSFAVTVTSGGTLFTTAPAIDADGDLTYTLAANANGTATIEVVLTDSGSNTAPHDNTSVTETFTITVNPINDAPTFTIADNSLEVDENAGAQTENDFVTSISSGPPDESNQTLLAFNVVLVAGSVTGDLAFDAGPSIDTDGDLTFTITPGTTGSATFRVTLVDSGLNTPPNEDTSAEATFTITTINPQQEPEGEASDASAIDAALLEWLLTHSDGEFDNLEVGSDEWQAAVDEAMALLA